jgi:hypothetical protein
MTDQEDHDRSDTMSVKDMQEWLQEQIRDSERAHELRIKEASGFVSEYAQGKLTHEQAIERMKQYDLRWGAPLFGASAAPGISDEEIVQTMDQLQREHNARLREMRRKDFGR